MKKSVCIYSKPIITNFEREFTFYKPCYGFFTISLLLNKTVTMHFEDDYEKLHESEKSKVSHFGSKGG